MDIINDDIKLCIITFLDYTTILRLYQTCKHYSNIEYLLIEKSKQKIDKSKYIIPYKNLNILNKKKYFLIM